jgi:cytochrome o ubiquinol oxidase operon protein cyoD
MSETQPSHQHNHGSVTSYVIGFILSLVFTIIPYLLVVNKLITGDVLLFTILGFGILQMFIQMFFFLHLGRGPKPLYNVIFFAGTAGTIMIVVVASIFITDNLYRNMMPDEVTRKLAQKEGIAQVGDKPTGACQGNKRNHVVVITDSEVQPLLTTARLCDTITFINDRDGNVELVFGTYNQTVSYGGEDKVLLDDGRPETITLNQAGNFIFRDRSNQGIIGQFSVE